MAPSVDTGLLEVASKYVRVLRENNVRFESAWLFGSFAHSRANEDSDIDIALVMRNVEVKFLKKVELMKYRRGVDSRIEPHVLTMDEMDSPFSLEIMRTGVKVA